MVKLDYQVFLKGMSIVSETFENFKITENKLEIFYKNLNEYEAEEFKYAINEVCKTEKYAPTIAHIREKIESLKNEDIDLAEEFAGFVCSELKKGFPITFKKHREINFKKYGKIGLEVLEIEAEYLSGISIKDINSTLKSQLRESYKRKATQEKNNNIIKNNNLKLNQTNNQILELTNKIKIGE